MAKKQKQTKIVDVAEYEGKGKGKGKTQKPKALNRSAAVVRAMQSLGDGFSLPEVGDAGAKLMEKAGEPGNPRETRFRAMLIAQALVELGALRREGRNFYWTGRDAKSK
jgi:hypothetical protein